MQQRKIKFPSEHTHLYQQNIEIDKTTNTDDETIESKYKYIFKILMVGDQYVGKRSLVWKYVWNEFPAAWVNRRGPPFEIKKMYINDNRIKLQIYHPIPSMNSTQYLSSDNYWNVRMIIMVYDVTKPETFENLKNWNLEIEKFARNDVIKILMANKVDLVDDKKCIEDDDVKRMIKEMDIAHFAVVSAKTGPDTAVEDTFKFCANYLYEFCENEKIRAIKPFYG